MENVKELRYEMANALIHGIAVLFGIASMPVLSAVAVKTGNIPDIAGVTIYALGFLMAFAFSTLVYIAMGCLLFVGGKTFFVVLPTLVMVWLMIGGGFYIFGCIFYLNKKIIYHHAIWHLFVLSAAICHYVAVLLVFVK